MPSLTVPPPSVDEGAGLRVAVDADIAEHDWNSALSGLRRLFDGAPFLSNAKKAFASWRGGQ